MTYTVCSFDVGIKNLAYCIISFTDGKYEIIKWDIINLVKDDDKFCGELTRKNKLCGNKARFYGKMGGGVKYYCKTHCKYHIPFEAGWKEKMMVAIGKKDDCKCTYVLPKKGVVCGKRAHFENKSESGGWLCGAHKKLMIKRVEKEYELKKVKRVKCTSKNMAVLGERMYRELDEIKEMLEVDEALIENQPSMVNPSAKTIASLLFGYFIMRGVIERKNDKKKMNVKWISPSNKLKVNEDQTMKIMKNIKGASEKYKMTKKLAVEYTRILLKNDMKWLDHFNTFKKLDDLADAMLQGIYYLHKNKK